MQCYPVLFRMCQRFFDDEHEIITAINNGMLRVFKNIFEFDQDKSELVTWVYSIVRNEALTLVRNNKKVISPSELTAEFSHELVNNPFEKQEEPVVIQCLGKLPETTRAACNLFYVEGYSIKEIATSLDMKEGTVKWHLSEGRKKIQLLFSMSGLRVSRAV